MPGEFHLSIKNTQRKIVDVRDLFKNLTETEWRILELAKQHAEEAKRLQVLEENEALFKQSETNHNLRYNKLDKMSSFSSQPNLEKLSTEKNSPNLLLYEPHNIVNYRKLRLQNRDPRYSMMFMPPSKESAEFSDRTQDQFVSRCFSHSNVDNIPAGGSPLNNYTNQYNIIQKVSKKRPPKPKRANENINNNDSMSSKSEDSNLSNPNLIKTKVIRIHSKTPPKTPPQPKVIQNPIDSGERRHFHGLKTRVKNHFHVVEKKFPKLKFSQVFNKLHNLIYL